MRNMVGLIYKRAFNMMPVFRGRNTLLCSFGTWSDIQTGTIRCNVKPKKIAIVVPNPCNPDYRVIRQAETLARQGHEVRIYATRNPTTPAYEEFNGVTYLRERWNIVFGFVSWVSGSYKQENNLAAERRRQEKILMRAKKSTKKAG